MAIEVKLPDLGEGIKSGDVLDILVKAGDDVAKGQGLIEIETDKATVEVPSPAAGKVVRILVGQGQSIPIGATIAELEPAGAAAAPAPSPTPAPAAQAAPAPTPPAQTLIQTPQVAAPSVQPAPTSVPPTTAPPVARPATPPPVIAPAAAPAPLAPAVTTAVTDTAFAGAIAPAGPAIRRLAREVGVELSQVVGTGPAGRITREDVMAVVRQSGVRPTSIGLPTATAPTAAVPLSPASEPTAAPSAVAPAAPTANPVATPGQAATSQTTAPAAPVTGVTAGTDAWGPVEIERASKIRRTIAARMTESWTTVPRVTNFDDADVTELERVRQASKADYAAAGVKLTSLPFVIKAVALSLRHHPLLNASFDLEHEQIIYKKYINVGIAVDTDRGLVVPALRHADQMGIPEMARALAKITESARTNSFTVDDLRGSTFTISNLGAIGGTYSTPIVNTPEVAILLVGRSRKLPVVVDDQVVVRLMMPLSLSYDHRLVDGGAAARFLNDVIGYLEAPSRLFLAP